MKEKLLGLNLEELRDVCKSEGLPAFAASQLANWLYVKRIASVDDMTNISKTHRYALSQKYVVGREAPKDVAVSKDGTKKYLFKSFALIGDGAKRQGKECGEQNIGKKDSGIGREENGVRERRNGIRDEVKNEKAGVKDERVRESFIESVMIPDEERFTLCVSSQAGCRMGCKFCMTGRQGFHGNLSTAEILNQFFSITEAEKLTNAVFMGMGEPLDNCTNVFKAIEILTAPWGCGWSPKRITVSTIGVNVKKLLDETKVHVAISMHNPFSSQRFEMMPAEHAHPFQKTLQLLKQYDFTGQRRVSFEYIMFKGLNDSKKHADAIVRSLKGLECRVNLIRFHDIGDTVFKTSLLPVIEAFKDRLNAAGITTTLRASRGEDIAAACGMLAGKADSQLNVNI